jgi:type II secretory pathway pseudopilin PulG
MGSPERGSTLLFTIIMLAVLTIIGVSAVSLSSRERTNAAVTVRTDQLRACAAAAQGQIWAELARYGPGYFTSDVVVGTLSLPDGSRLAAPAHYDTALNANVRVKSVALPVPDGAGGASTVSMSDLTNGGRMIAGFGNNPYQVVATCYDERGREFEVEFGVRLAL